MARFVERETISERRRKEKRMPAPPESAPARRLCSDNQRKECRGDKQNSHRLHCTQSGKPGINRTRCIAVLQSAVTGRLVKIRRLMRHTKVPCTTRFKPRARQGDSAHDITSQRFFAAHEYSCSLPPQASPKLSHETRRYHAVLAGYHCRPRHVLGVQPLPPSRKG